MSFNHPSKQEKSRFQNEFRIAYFWKTPNRNRSSEQNLLNSMGEFTRSHHYSCPQRTSTLVVPLLFKGKYSRVIDVTSPQVSKPRGGYLRNGEDKID